MQFCQEHTILDFVTISNYACNLDSPCQCLRFRMKNLQGNTIKAAKLLTKVDQVACFTFTFALLLSSIF